MPLSSGRRVGAILIAFLFGCSGSSERGAAKNPSAEQQAGANKVLTPASAPGAARKPSSDADADAKMHKLKDLMLDVAVHEICEDARSDFQGLASASSDDIIEGRLFVQRCDARRDKDELKIDASGRGWRWIQRKTEKLEGTFQVDQYVRFKADGAARGKLDWDYVEPAHLLHIWFEPTAPAKVNIVPTSKVDVQPQSTWASLLGAATDLLGKSPDEKATQQVKTKGSKEGKQKIEEGYSFTFDLCTGQRYHDMGRVAPGDIPSKPVPARTHIWLQNQKVRVYPEGLDLAGPFDVPGGRVEIEISVEEGSSLTAKLICDQDAMKIAQAFLDDKKPPNVSALAEAVIKKGNAGHLEGDTSQCPAVLMTTTPKGKGPALFRYMARGANANVNPMADCGRDDSQERSPSERSPTR